MEQSTPSGEILDFLRSPFPAGSLSVRDGQKAYFQNQVYIDRLNDPRVREHVKQRITYQKVDMEQGIIEVRVLIKIGEAEREGAGIVPIAMKRGTKVPINLNNDIRMAKTYAIVDACDGYQMGWVDLAPYRKDWGNNPALFFNREREQMNSMAEETEKSTHVCKVCGVAINDEQVQFLRHNLINIDFCKEHVPPHMIRNP